MFQEHLSTRKLITYIAFLIVVLYLTGESNYVIPIIEAPLNGKALWPALALAQSALLIKGILTGALTGVIPPWAVPREGPWGDKHVSKIPEYWVVFFKQMTPILLGMLSVILAIHQITKVFL